MLVHADLIEVVCTNVVNVHVRRLIIRLLHLLVHLLGLLRLASIVHRLLERLLALPSLPSGGIGHDALRLRDGLKCNSGGSRSFTCPLVILIGYLLIELVSS